jgi:hypothetical protein
VAREGKSEAKGTQLKSVAEESFISQPHKHEQVVKVLYTVQMIQTYKLMGMGMGI